VLWVDAVQDGEHSHRTIEKPWDNGDLYSNYGWLVVTGFYDFPFSWEWNNHPN